MSSAEAGEAISIKIKVNAENRQEKCVVGVLTNDSFAGPSWLVSTLLDTVGLSRKTKRLSMAKMQGFISYAHFDHNAFVRAEKHLSHVARAFKIDLWSDTRIKAGDYWSPRIQAEIAKSDIFILLVTNDFLGSSYIFDHELPALIDRHKNGNALLVPIILRRCGWRSFFGGYFQAVPNDGNGNLRPVLDWPKPENGFAAERVLTSHVRKS